MSAAAWEWQRKLKLTAHGREARTRVHNAKAVLVIVAYYADEHGVASPAADWITGHTGLHVRTVHRALVDLRAAGVLEVVARPAPGRATTYRVNVALGSATLPARPTTGETEESPARETPKVSDDQAQRETPKVSGDQAPARETPKVSGDGSNVGQTRRTSDTQGVQPQENTRKKEEEGDVSRPDGRLSGTPGDPRDNAADELEGDAPSEEAPREKAALPDAGAEVAVPAEDGALCARCWKGSSAGPLWEAGGVPFHAEHLPAGVVVPAEPEPEPEPPPKPKRSPKPKRAPSPPGAPPLADRLAAELARRPDGATVAELVAALDLDGGTVRTTLGRHPDRFAKDGAAPGEAVRWHLIGDGSNVAEAS